MEIGVDELELGGGGWWRRNLDWGYLLAQPNKLTHFQRYIYIGAEQQDS